MKSMSRISIKMKLFGGFAAIVILIMTILVTAYVSLNEAESSQRKMVDDNFGNLYDLPTLRANINAQRLAVAMLIETEASGRAPWLDELQRRRRMADDIINNLILRFRDDPRESELLGEFISVRDLYDRLQDTQIDLLVGQRNTKEARALFLGSQTENYTRMRTLLAELERTEITEARGMLKWTKEIAQQRSRAFFIMGGLSVLLAAVLAIYTSRTVASYVLELKSRESALSRVNRSLKMLNECNSIAIHATDEVRFLEDICRTIVDVGGHRLAWVGYADDDKNKSVRPMAFAGENGDYVEHANISWAENERGKGPTGTVIRTGEVVVVGDTATEPGYDPWRYRAIEKGYRSSATFPLRDAARVYGALMVYSGIPRAFDDEEIRLMTELADDIAFATTALRDLSARLQAEKKAREAAAYNRSLLEASLDPLMVIGISGKIADVNEAAEKITGKSRAELIGFDFSGCFTDPAKANAGFREVLSNGQVRDLRLTIRHVTDGVTDVLFNASVVRNEAGELQGVFGAARECTSHSGVIAC